MKGGQHACRAAMLCTEAQFPLYLDYRRRTKNALEWEELPDGTHTAEDAADFIRHACGVQSRAELDHNAQARAMLYRIVKDYNRWKQITGIMDHIAGEAAND